MHKAQRDGAELLPGDAVLRGKGQRFRRAVLRVAQNGTAEGAAMQTELVRAAGQGRQLSLAQPFRVSSTR